MYTRIFKMAVLSLLIPMPGKSQHADEKSNILAVVHYFFDALRAQDTLALRSLFLEKAMTYYVQEGEDSIVTANQSPSQINFSKDRVIVERMRLTTVMVNVQQRIAAAWIPYDLWINGEFSHCGVDVFTLIKTKEGWKISSLSFSREFSGCTTTFNKYPYWPDYNQ
jgi:Putative lumazine-binding